ncbi:MAG: Rrf2 family transcriptional regulator [Peptostreptococcaceae bacterium]|nr:Rrf2 family transcriptional regulator [Peptostreptococcaceae bacterium]
MQITSRFTLAIHTMLCIASFSSSRKVTSNFIAESTNSNPVIIRRLIGQLKEAGLVEVKPGIGGATVAKPLDEINLKDIFNAVEVVNDKMFNFHDNPNCKCPVGKNIHTILDEHLNDIEEAMNNQMRKTNLMMLLEETKPYL